MSVRTNEEGFEELQEGTDNLSEDAQSVKWKAK